MLYETDDYRETNAATSPLPCDSTLLNYERIHTAVCKASHSAPERLRRLPRALAHETAKRLALRLGFQQRVQLPGERALHDLQ